MKNFQQKFFSLSANLSQNNVKRKTKDTFPQLITCIFFSYDDVILAKYMRDSNCLVDQQSHFLLFFCFFFSSFVNCDLFIRFQMQLVQFIYELKTYHHTVHHSLFIVVELP